VTTLNAVRSEVVVEARTAACAGAAAAVQVLGTSSLKREFGAGE
jgi:hypothetical protein